MDVPAFSEWLASLSVAERIRALALIYSILTVHARELFLPDRTAGKERRVLEMLHGLSEIHHTLATSLVAYASDKEALPVQYLSQQLLEIASQYRIEGLLTPAVERARGSRIAQK